MTFTQCPQSFSQLHDESVDEWNVQTKVRRRNCSPRAKQRLGILSKMVSDYGTMRTPAGSSTLTTDEFGPQGCRSTPLHRQLQIPGCGGHAHVALASGITTEVVNDPPGLVHGLWTL